MPGGASASRSGRSTSPATADGNLGRSGLVRFGMPGPLRAMTYRLAAATGFRVAELHQLTPESFRLAGPEPSVVLKASSTKNRPAADQLLPSALALDPAAGLRDEPAGVPVLPLHHETAKATRADLGAAGVAYET